MAKATTEKLKETIAEGEKGQEPKKEVSPVVMAYRTVEAHLNKLMPELEKALPNTGVTAERLARIALTCTRTNPDLLNCSVPSLLGAVMQAAQLGLTPNLMGSCYLIPYNDKKEGKVVSFQIGYRGLIDLVARSGFVTTIKSNCVYENDEFDYEFGLNEYLKHKPAQEDRGKKITHVYAYAKMRHGGHAFEVMSVEDINKIRDQHSAQYRFKKENSIWGQHYESMAKKTVLKQLVKYLPISTEFHEKVSQDETVRKDVAADPEYIEVEAVDYENFDIGRHEPDFDEIVQEG